MNDTYFFFFFLKIDLLQSAFSIPVFFFFSGLNESAYMPTQKKSGNLCTVWEESSEKQLNHMIYCVLFLLLFLSQIYFISYTCSYCHNFWTGVSDSEYDL